MKIQCLKGQANVEDLNEVLRPEFSDLIEKKPDWWKLHSELIDKGLSKGFKFAAFHQPTYPSLLRHTSQPPTLFHYLGDPAWLHHPCLSVVGSRKPLMENLEWMEQHLDRLLHKLNICIVSGGARGIDQKAHQLAIWAGAPTIVVVPSGLTDMYPGSLDRWKDSVVDGGGCFLSQFSPIQPMYKANFHLRNRVIVGLSPLLFLIQAARRSGSYLSARFAIEEHRTLAVLPGSAHSEHMLGSLDLIFDGAQMVRDSYDLISLCEQLHIASSKGNDRSNDKEKVSRPDSNPCREVLTLSQAFTRNVEDPIGNNEPDG